MFRLKRQHWYAVFDISASVFKVIYNMLFGDFDRENMFYIMQNKYCLG